MSLTLEELGVYQMSFEQRAALAQEILDSVVAEQPVAALSPAKRQELQRGLPCFASVESGRSLRSG